MQKFVKKPIEIEAMIYDGKNQKDCVNFIGEENIDMSENFPNIITSEGTMRVSVGDYIIKEPFDKRRKFYPCKPDVFAKTYEELSNKPKLGMYGENPRVIIGSVSIAQMSNLDPSQGIWVEKNGEGAQLRGEVVEKAFRDVFYKLF